MKKRMLKTIFLSFSIIALAMIVVLPYKTHAAASQNFRNDETLGAPVGGENFVPTQSLPCDENAPGTGVCFNNPLTNAQQGLKPTVIWGRLIRFMLSIIGSVTLLFFVMGGVKWMTAGGSPEKIKEAQGTLVWATIGLALVLVSYLLMSNIINTLLRSFGIQ